MSLSTTQIIRGIDREAGTTNASYPIADKVQDINITLDDFFALAIQASGEWQIDDTNHAYFPIIKTNLVSGRRDYSFLTDEEGVMILDIHKVLRADQNGVVAEISPVDQQTNAPRTLTDGRNTTGIPDCYDKTGNTIFLDPIPNYNSTLGLQVMINREGSYITVSDTTKKPGVAGLFHEYFILCPAYKRVSAKAKTNADVARANRIFVKIEKLEAKIVAYYSRRARDQKPVLNSVGRERVDYV
jgi:hypothetical protein